MTPQAGTKKLDKRAMVVKEIVDTERKYVSELKVLVECFVRPSRLYLSELRTLSGVSGGAQDGVGESVEKLLDQHSSMFSNVEQLCCFNEVFLKDIQVRMCLRVCAWFLSQ